MKLSVWEVTEFLFVQHEAGTGNARFVFHKFTWATLYIVTVKGKGKGKAVPSGLEWPRGFQGVKVPRFRDNGTGW